MKDTQINENPSSEYESTMEMIKVDFFPFSLKSVTFMRLSQVHHLHKD